MAAPIPFADFSPDVTSLGTDTVQNVRGALPKADGWGPFPDAVEYGGALPAPCAGYFYARKSDGTIAVFAGTVGRLYRFNNTSLAWDDVSKNGTDYPNLSGSAFWQFVKFNDLVIAVQVNTAPQVFNLASDTEFSDLGGNPPAAGFVSIVNRFLVLTGLLSNPTRIQWSDLDGPTTWTAGVRLSDFQDLPDLGATYTVAGGDAYGVVFQDEGVRSLVYAPGSAVTFQITKLSSQDAIYGPYSVINTGDKIFFCSTQGFKVITAGASPQPIGKERVDGYFFKNVDSGNSGILVGAYDPQSTRVFWAYKSMAGTVSGQFNTLLCFDWALGKNGRWSVIPLAGRYLVPIAKPGLTLEGMDAIDPNLDTFPYSFDLVPKAYAVQLTAMTPNNKLGVFTGSNIEAVLETPEQDADGQTVFINYIQPLTDCAAAMVSIGKRMSPNAAVTYTAETTLDDQGYAPQLIETRFARANVRMPAGSTWTYARGVHPDGMAGGIR